MTGMNALRQAMVEALRGDEAVVVLGEALDLCPATQGLAAAFPGRAHLLPASDGTLLGVAVGLALAGRKPVVELAGPEALWGTLQQLGQEAAVLRTNPELAAPLVVRVPLTPGSVDPSGLLLGLGGLAVAAVGEPADGAAMLRSALAARGPTVLLEPLDVLAEVASESEDLPAGRARLARTGAHATALAWGAGLGAALAAADALEANGIALEVLDPRWLSPLDVDAIAASVHKTGRAILVGGAVAALVPAVRAAFLRLEAPPAEVAADADAIAAATRASLEY